MKKNPKASIWRYFYQFILVIICILFGLDIYRMESSIKVSQSEMNLFASANIDNWLRDDLLNRLSLGERKVLLEGGRSSYNFADLIGIPEKLFPLVSEKSEFRPTVETRTRDDLLGLSKDQDFFVEFVGHGDASRVNFSNNLEFLRADVKNLTDFSIYFKSKPKLNLTIKPEKVAQLQFFFSKEGMLPITGRIVFMYRNLKNGSVAGLYE